MSWFHLGLCALTKIAVTSNTSSGGGTCSESRFLFCQGQYRVSRLKLFLPPLRLQEGSQVARLHLKNKSKFLQHSGCLPHSSIVHRLFEVCKTLVETFWIKCWAFSECPALLLPVWQFPLSFVIFESPPGNVCCKYGHPLSGRCLLRQRMWINTLVKCWWGRGEELLCSWVFRISEYILNIISNLLCCFWLNFLHYGLTNVYKADKSFAASSSERGISACPGGQQAVEWYQGSALRERHLLTDIV